LPEGVSPESRPYFFPDAVGVIDHAAKQRLSKKGELYRLTLKKSEHLRSPLNRLSGVLVFSGHSGSAERKTALLVEAAVRKKAFFWF